MADVPKRAGLGRPAVIAIGFAVVALVTSVIAVIVVMRRSASQPAIVAAASSARIDRTIDASEVTKLKRDVVEKAVDDRGEVIGVTVKDEPVRTALGLEPSTMRCSA